MKIFQRLMIPLVAAFTGLMLFGASTAYAGADGPTLCNSGACTWFLNGGDIVYVQDVAADGHSAVAQVCAPSNCSTVAEYLWNPDGNGTIRHKQYGTAIPEGTTVYYRPCIGEYNSGGSTSTIISCSSGWTHGTA
jgi:hypothetical protein